jgi:hypothetical protein
LPFLLLKFLSIQGYLLSLYTVSPEGVGVGGVGGGVGGVFTHVLFLKIPTKYLILILSLVTGRF